MKIKVPHIGRSGFGMVETIIASGLVLVFILAAGGLQAHYTRLYASLAKATNAQVLALQVISDLKANYNRYPYARVGGNPVLYRRCYSRNLEPQADGDKPVRVLTDKALGLCLGTFMVDIVPVSMTDKIYSIQISSNTQGEWVPNGGYRVAF